MNQDGFWEGVEEVCIINKTFVKVLRLIDWENPTMDYLYKAIDSANQAIKYLYEEKASME
jgi:hypothetical protein